MINVRKSGSCPDVGSLVETEQKLQGGGNLWPIKRGGNKI